MSFLSNWWSKPKPIPQEPTTIILVFKAEAPVEFQDIFKDEWRMYAGDHVELTFLEQRGLRQYWSAPLKEEDYGLAGNAIQRMVDKNWLKTAYIRPPNDMPEMMLSS